MSYSPNFDEDDDLPEYIKEFIKNFSKQFGSVDAEELTEAMKKFNQVDPSEIEEMFRKMFGEDFLDKLSSIGESIFGNMGANFDPSNMPDIADIKIHFANLTTNKNQPTTVDNEPMIDEEAYYEIVETGDGVGEIIIDLPGITDQRQINWEIRENTLVIRANNEDMKYHCNIEIPNKSQLQKHLTRLNNSVFIIPFRRK